MKNVIAAIITVLACAFAAFQWGLQANCRDRGGIVMGQSAGWVCIRAQVIRP